MKLTTTETEVQFEDGNRLAGSYQFHDPYKPHIHPLRSPVGHTISASQPHDHDHHRGLMFALQTKEVNFWAEVPEAEGEAVGRQRHVRFDDVVESGERVGFSQQLVWEDVEGRQEVFREQRSIYCSVGSGGIFQWDWRTELVSLRRQTLILSKWSAPNPSGQKVSFNGLGCRFIRSFGWTGPTGSSMQLDGQAADFEASGFGARNQSASFIGAIDGLRPIPRVKYTVTQQETDDQAYFIVNHPAFAYCAVGPSNLEPLELSEGQVLALDYRIEVGDEAP
ncbi:MAG TPA: hypothetical protein DEA90_10435 [Opitutae bacterium]|nr:hypothetical protein [Opitutae bacterium]|tara:strand:- start:37 stop:873 length:837 start_codon:yes stop_codon:yes gene_type:complete